MPLTMYDSTEPTAIPAGAALVASYVDGYGGYTEAVSRFGADKVISISVENNDADVADVESGAMSASELPGWISRQKARGVTKPVIYCNASTWPSVKAAVGGASVSYWIAEWTGNPSQELAGADAVQYASNNSYDESYVLDSFPFYPGAPKPTPPPTPPKPPVAGSVPVVATWLGDAGLTTRKTNIPSSAWVNLKFPPAKPGGGIPVVLTWKGAGGLVSRTTAITVAVWDKLKWKDAT